MSGKSKLHVSVLRAAWWLPCLIAGAAVAAEEQAATAATTYCVINLGSGSLAEIPAINANGQATFTLNNDSGTRAWFYDGATIRNIGTLGGSMVNAVDVNDRGQVVGYSQYGDSGHQHAFLWSRSTGMIDLGGINGDPDSMAAAINNFGLVTGSSGTDALPNPPHAFLSTLATGMEDLGTLDGYLSFGVDVNDAGLVAGSSYLQTSSASRAFAWTRGTGMLDLGTLGGSESYAVAAAAEGQVAGYSNVRDGSYHAFFWTRATGMLDLGTAGGAESFVLAMSRNAHVAGVINTASGDQHAMSWTRRQGMIDLGTFGGPSSRAIGVNTKGQVVGWAMTRSTSEVSRAFLWTKAHGLIDLNKRVHNLPKGMLLQTAVAISDNGSIVAETNTGLVLLKPGKGHKSGPAVGPISAPEMIAVGAPLSVSASFANEDTAATHRVNWTWGDGGSERVLASESSGAGSVGGMHVYTRPGVYTVTAQMEDQAGNKATVSRDIVVYDPAESRRPLAARQFKRNWNAYAEIRPPYLSQPRLRKYQNGAIALPIISAHAQP